LDGTLLKSVVNAVVAVKVIPGAVLLAVQTLFRWLVSRNVWPALSLR